ncbi:MAG: glutamate 5-kinase [Lachnospiraceae bacterium]|nr:glutamate 5-kinase [Lachnospiraceae bacterium]
MSELNISKRKRIVIKIGTSTITHHKTGMLNIRRVEKLVKTIADLKNTGYEIIMVSSGSIGLGAGKLGLSKRPKDTPGKQACAAVGQCELMYIYDKLFSEYSITVAQMLLTKYVLIEDRRVNVSNAMERLIDIGAIPIVNENDTVAIDELELEVGENDTLAAIVADISNADLLILMSDIEGLYTEDPRENENAILIKRVEKIDENIKKFAGGAGTKFGTGGMASKLDAVEVAFKHDIDVVLMSGKKPEKLYDLFENKPVGTFFTNKG